MSWQVLADDIPDTHDVIPYPYGKVRQVIQFPLRLIITGTDNWQATATQTRPTLQLTAEWNLGSLGDHAALRALTTSDKPCIVPLQSITSQVSMTSATVLTYTTGGALSRLPKFDYVCLFDGRSYVYKQVSSQDDTTITLSTPLSREEQMPLSSSLTISMEPCVVMTRQTGATSTIHNIDTSDRAYFSIPYGSVALPYDYTTPPDLTSPLSEDRGRRITVGDKRIIENDEEQQTIIASTLARRRLQTVSFNSGVIVPRHELLLRRLSYVYVTPSINALHPLVADTGETLQVLVTQADLQIEGVVARMSLSSTILLAANEIT